MLAAITEFERELIMERTGEGRKLKLSAFQCAEAAKRRDAAEPLAVIAKSYAVLVSMDIAEARSALLVTPTDGTQRPTAEAKGT